MQQSRPKRTETRDGSRRLLAATCCLVLFLYALYLGALSVLLPFIGAAFGLGAAAEGRLFPANFLGFVVGVLVCGALSDRLGRKAVLLLGIGLYAGGLGLFATLPSFAAALAATALVGAGTGAMETVASALAADLFPDRRAVLLNGLQIAFGAGAAVSPAIAHALLTAGTDWHALYLGLAAANVLLFVVLLFQPVPRVPHAAEALDLVALRAVLHQPAFLILCLAQALYVGAETGFFSWMPTYFQKHLPGGSAWAGLVVTVFWIAMTCGRVATGGLVGRVPVLRLTLWLAVGGAVGSGLALLWTAPVAVLCFVAWTGLCFSGIFGLILAETGERFPRAAGTAFGGVVAAGGIGGALVPWSVGVLADTGLGWRGALLLVPLAATAIGLLMRRPEIAVIAPAATAPECA